MDKLSAAREKINSVDSKMAKLFEERMKAVRDIAEYKAENSLPILDACREAEVIEKNASLIENDEIKAHYTAFLKNNIKISHSYQAELYPELLSGVLYESENVKRIRVQLEKDSYDIILGCGILARAHEYLNLLRRVLILTDSGVPTYYAQEIAKNCKEAHIYTVEQGEESKNLANYEKILSFMAQNRFTRGDCVVAVGGGVVGDLAGFVASSYMRGVDFSSGGENDHRYRFAYAENMYKDYESDGVGIVESIPGFRKISALGERIHAIYSQKDESSHSLQFGVLALQTALP